MVDLAHAASWRDEVFPCIRITGNHGNALAMTTFPSRDGQHVRNLGKVGSSWNVMAKFCKDMNGVGPYPADLWPAGWLRFEEALKNRERGWFDHPMFGRAYAMAQTWSVEVSETTRETIDVTIDFQEANLDDPTFELILGPDAVTEDGAEARAVSLDASLQALVIEQQIGDVFLTAWSTFMFAMSSVERVLTYKDAVYFTNQFQRNITDIIVGYPVILDPLNWEIQKDIALMRRDANVIATRISGEGKRLTTWENKSMRSALAIVIALYNDASREEEFLKLNGSIKNPLFVPPGTYNVYSDFFPGSGERAV